jgi:hypothetical protein
VICARCWTLARLELRSVAMSATASASGSRRLDQSSSVVRRSARTTRGRCSW